MNALFCRLLLYKIVGTCKCRAVIHINDITFNWPSNVVVDGRKFYRSSIYQCIFFRFTALSTAVSHQQKLSVARCRCFRQTVAILQQYNSG